MCCDCSRRYGDYNHCRRCSRIIAEASDYCEPCEEHGVQLVASIGGGPEFKEMMAKLVEVLKTYAAR